MKRLFQQWSLEFWLHIPWTMFFFLWWQSHLGQKKIGVKFNREPWLIQDPGLILYAVIYATDCMTYIPCGKASFVFLLFPPPSCKQAIIAKHSTKFSQLRNAGFVTIQSMNPSLLNRWHVMLLDCKLPPFSLLSPRVTIRSVASLSAWTAEKSSKETHQYSSRCGTAVDKEEVLISTHTLLFSASWIWLRLMH